MEIQLDDVAGICKGCDHLDFAEGSNHCYMFKDRPTDYCGQHTQIQAEIRKLPRAQRQLLRMNNFVDIVKFINKSPKF